MFEKITEFIKQFSEGIKNVCSALPKELRVGIYLFGSLFLSELLTQLELIKIENRFLLMLSNVVIVFATQFPKRLQELKQRFEK